MSEIQIVEFCEHYKESVVEHILAIQCGEFAVSITREDQPDIMDIPNFYQSKKGKFWLAVDGDRIAGTIALLDIGNGQAALRKMFVHKDYRGEQKGVAKRLLQTAFDWAKVKETEAIFLGTTSKFLAAQRFYDKNGFERIAKESLPESFPVMKVDSVFYVKRLLS